MTASEAIGTAGVSLLLLAFFLNLFGLLGSDTRAYQGMNAFGAGAACYASWLIPFFPFVILEGTWAVVSIVALVRAGSRASR
ncbi:MAG: hypothetical protein E4H03_04975 [Myxococcales bacterium]|jgi:hypothetical protein|nr:MAG: hypothetical protein E4H03_04975 [Myxococcales bacterium]